MVTYQFDVGDETWSDWKNTVPRSKSLDTRLRELIEADTEGRVREEAAPETPNDAGEGSPSSPPGGAKRAPQGATVPDSGEELRDQIREGLSGSGDLLERRVDEVLKMYDALRELGEAEKDDLLAAVDIEATDYQDGTSVWSNMVKGKGTLSALPGVESPSTGKSEWRYTGDA